MLTGAVMVKAVQLGRPQDPASGRPLLRVFTLKQGHKEQGRRARGRSFSGVGGSSLFSIVRVLFTFIAVSVGLVDAPRVLGSDGD